jgi:hypothetical protein
MWLWSLLTSGAVRENLNNQELSLSLTIDCEADTGSRLFFGEFA